MVAEELVYALTRQLISAARHSYRAVSSSPKIHSCAQTSTHASSDLDIIVPRIGQIPSRCNVRITPQRPTAIDKLFVRRAQAKSRLCATKTDRGCSASQPYLTRTSSRKAYLTDRSKPSHETRTNALTFSCRLRTTTPADAES